MSEAALLIRLVSVDSVTVDDQLRLHTARVPEVRCVAPPPTIRGQG